MIIREFYGTRGDGVKLYRIYSDADAKLKQLETGIIYDDVIDVENAGYNYTETE